MSCMTIISAAPRFQYWFNAGSSWGESWASNFTSPDIYIWPENTDEPPSWFVWTSPHLDDVASPQELMDRTSSLKAVFDGAMYLAAGSHYVPFQLTDLEAERPEDRSWLYGSPEEPDPRVEPFSAVQVAAKAESQRNPMGDPVARVIFLARYDELTRNLLKFLGIQGLSYISLYGLRDWMKSGKWDDARIAAEAGWSGAKFDDFTNTANNPTYLGPFCRHGGLKPAPKRPMPLAEAVDPLLQATRKFLLERGTQIGIGGKWKSLQER